VSAGCRDWRSDSIIGGLLLSITQIDRTRPAEALAIRRADLHSQTVQRLIEALNAEFRATYPEPGATHVRLDADEVTADKGAFLIGYLQGEPVACGAIRCLAADVAEIKRMYVIPAARGRGFSTSILAALEENGRQLGVRRLVLETGPRQLEALALDRRAGYVPVPRFDEYLNSELSLCMSKDLQLGIQTSGSQSGAVQHRRGLESAPEGDVHAVSSERRMRAVLQGHDAVIKKARRTAPNDDITVRERHAARPLGAVGTAK